MSLEIKCDRCGKPLGEHDWITKDTNSESICEYCRKKEPNRVKEFTSEMLETVRKAVIMACHEGKSLEDALRIELKTTGCEIVKIYNNEKHFVLGQNYSEKSYSEGCYCHSEKSDYDEETVLLDAEFRYKGQFAGINWLLDLCLGRNR